MSVAVISNITQGEAVDPDPIFSGVDGSLVAFIKTNIGNVNEPIDITEGHFWTEDRLEKPKPLPMLYAEAFEKAAEMIEAGGWIQGAGRDGDARCMGRALSTAASRVGLGDYNETESQARPFINHIAAHYFGGSIPAWNDRCGRTKEEVVLALRTLAQNERRMLEVLG